MGAALRIMFVALILLGIGERVVWCKFQRQATDPVAALAARMNLIGLKNHGPDGAGVISASAPSCPEPALVGLYAIDGGENARYAALLMPGKQPLFIYLGAVRERPDPLRALAGWAGATAAAMLGMRHAPVPTKMVVAMLPDACGGLARVDWARLSPAE
jgi:hypothetical protein